MTEQERHLNAVKRHIEGVYHNCVLLSDRLYENGEKELARELVANGFIHDNSKFYGIEWEYLTSEAKELHPTKFKEAIIHHQTHNKHHPEYWGSIQDMPRLYVAEMVCDVKTRSNEFGKDIREWVKTVAVDKYNFTLKSRVYREIKYFLDLILEDFS